jgi:hypothetical protein
MATPADEETVLPATAAFTDSGLSHQLSEAPNDDEIAKALELPGVFGPMKKKKELIKPVLENLEAVVRRLNRADAALGATFCDDLPASVKASESKNCSARMTAERLVHVKN